MKEITGWDLVEAVGERKSLPKGIYVMKIENVVDNQEREYLEIYSDVAEGEYKNYFATILNMLGRDYSREIRSYKTKALPFFKAFITAVEHSNPGYSWNWDEKSLIGKFVVGVFGEEEYLSDGEVKVSVKLQEFRSLQALREGKIKVPELKKLPEEAKVEKPTIDISNTDLPF